MHEDDIYRQSSQFRLWSFTPERLASLRESTNTLAATRVRDAVRRSRENGVPKPKSGTSNGAGSGSDGDGRANGAHPAKPAAAARVECLSVDEERVIVEYYCSQAIAVSTSEKGFGFPPEVTVSLLFSVTCQRKDGSFADRSKATAVQFLKRFYLSNSPMTYHPRDIMLTALFFVTKTEPFYISLDKFVSIMQANSSKKRVISAETVLAPEFILTQGIRFNFVVKHPYRALRGIHVELLSMSQGTAALPAHEKRSPSDLQQELRALKMASGSTAPVGQRLNNAYASASDCLKKSAILTDAYFFYTPSQIAFAALLLEDEPLTVFYLGTKFPASADKIRVRALTTIRQCAQILKEGPAFEKLPREELVRIDKKLYQCQNPEKMDFVGLNKSVKRDHSVEGKLDDDQKKKRKLERERGMREGEDLFGPSLQKNESKEGG